MAESTFSKQFLDDYKEFVKNFDASYTDLYQGEPLDKLGKDFYAKYSDYLASFSFAFKSGDCKFPKCNLNEALDEDLEIMSSPTDIIVDECSKILGDIYRRLCQGSYMRLTFNKYRHDKEEDRKEPVDFGRHAIRFDAQSFPVCYWYMISLGWQLNIVNQPKERTMVGRVFRQTTMRNIQLSPDDYLAHHLLGRYYYSVASLSWLERTVANNVLGAKLEGTYQDAEKCFLKSHQLRDDWLPNGLWMAKTLSGQKRPSEEIKKWVDFGLEMQCTEPTSDLERKELIELQSKLKLSN